MTHEKDADLFARIDAVVSGHERQRSGEFAMTIDDRGRYESADRAPGDDEVVTVRDSTGRVVGEYIDVVHTNVTIVPLSASITFPDPTPEPPDLHPPVVYDDLAWFRRRLDPDADVVYFPPPLTADDVETDSRQELNAALAAADGQRQLAALWVTIDVDHVGLPEPPALTGERTVLYERAVNVERTESDERAAAHEGTDVDERAILSESTVAEERAVGSERTIGIEPAAHAASTGHRERAVNNERAVSGERAVFTASTEPPERADERASTVPDERVVSGERTAELERAWERVERDLEPHIQDRAAAFERTRTVERAAIRESTVAFEPLDAGDDEWTDLDLLNSIPTNAAAIIEAAVTRMTCHGLVSPDAPWQAIEFLCADYLAGSP